MLSPGACVKSPAICTNYRIKPLTTRAPGRSAELRCGCTAPSIFALCLTTTCHPGNDHAGGDQHVPGVRAV